MRSLKLLLLAILLVPIFAFAAPYLTYQRSLVPIDTTENVGTSTSPWDFGYFNTICLTADGCRTTWPTSSGGGISFSADTNFNQQVYSTSTPTLWFKSGLYASSTSQFTNSTTTKATIGTTWFTGITGVAANCLHVDTNGLLSGTGSDCGSASGLASYDAWTHSTQYGQTVSATSTALHLTGAQYSLTASSTAVFANLQLGATTSPMLLGLLSNGTVVATSTPTVASLSATSTATSTFVGGINLSGTDCVAIGGTCLQTYIQNATAYKQAVNYATAAVLSGTPTYANGSSGVGATLTEVGFGALVVDGSTVTLGQRILVKNQADQTTNGIYTVTTVGSGIASYLLTRATDYNQSVDIYAGTTAPVLAGGTVNGDSQWTESTTGTIVVGTSNIVFIETSLGTAVDTFAFPFTTATTYNASQSATTSVYFTSGLFASSTSYFSNASTTAFTNSGSTWFSAITGVAANCLRVDTNGKLSGTGSDCGSASGLSAYDAWTHAAGGQSATTSAIGIGTTTPFSQLSVSSSTAGSALTSLFAIASNTNATLFNVLGNGAVGIGTTTPIGLLSINPDGFSGPPLIVGSSTSGAIFTVDATGTTTIKNLRLDDTGGNGKYWHIFEDSGNNLNIQYDAGYRRGVLINSGSLGQAFLGVGTTSTGGGGRVSFMIASNTPTMDFFDTDASTDNKHFLLSNDNGTFNIGTTSDSGGTASNFFFIDGQNGGNVGVDTNSPDFRLETVGTSVKGYFGLSSDISFNGDIFQVNAAGNVGAGTTSPGTILSLGNTGNDTINFSATATSTMGSGLNLRTGCFAISGICLNFQAPGFQISTSSSIGVSKVAYFGSTIPTKLEGVATTSVSAGSGLTGSLTTLGSGDAFGCATASASVFGCLTAANFATFNGKIGTSSSETKGQLPYWTSTSATPPTLGVVSTTTLTLTSFPANTPSTLGALIGGSNTTFTWWGLATTSALVQGQLLYNTTGNNGVASVATSTLAVNNGLTISASNGALVGGSAATIGLATINAGVLGAVTNGAVPTSQSTSTLYGGSSTGGFVLMFSNATNGLVLAATSSSSSGGIADPFTHPGAGYAATTSSMLFSTSTGSLASVIAASSTNPQYCNSDALGSVLWCSRNAGGNFYLATSTATATSTNTAFSLSNAAATLPALQIGTTTSSGILNLGQQQSTNGTSTIYMGKIQYDGYNSAGTRICTYVGPSNTWVVSSGACTP